MARSSAGDSQSSSISCPKSTRTVNHLSKVEETTLLFKGLLGRGILYYLSITPNEKTDEHNTKVKIMVCHGKERNESLFAIYLLLH